MSASAKPHQPPTAAELCNVTEFTDAFAKLRLLADAESTVDAASLMQVPCIVAEYT